MEHPKNAGRTPRSTRWAVVMTAGISLFGLLIVIVSGFLFVVYAVAVIREGAIVDDG